MTSKVSKSTYTVDGGAAQTDAPAAHGFVSLPTTVGDELNVAASPLQTDPGESVYLVEGWHMLHCMVGAFPRLINGRTLANDGYSASFDVIFLIRLTMSGFILCTALITFDRLSPATLNSFSIQSGRIFLSRSTGHPECVGTSMQSFVGRKRALGTRPSTGMSHED